MGPDTASGGDRARRSRRPRRSRGSWTRSPLSWTRRYDALGGRALRAARPHPRLRGAARRGRAGAVPRAPRLRGGADHPRPRVRHLPHEPRLRRWNGPGAPRRALARGARASRSPGRQGGGTLWRVGAGSPRRVVRGRRPGRVRPDYRRSWRSLHGPRAARAHDGGRGPRPAAPLRAGERPRDRAARSAAHGGSRGPDVHEPSGVASPAPLPVAGSALAPASTRPLAAAYDDLSPTSTGPLAAERSSPPSRTTRSP